MFERIRDFLLLPTKSKWQKKQELAAPSRFYGDGGTVHGTRHLDIEVCDGRVVAVWFRCQMLPFQQTKISPERYLTEAYNDPPTLAITGVEVLDVD